MLDYTGVKCPVCEAPFGKDDDIVVCPECGAPYHRECYHKAGKCVFDDLHEQGKEWQPPEPPKAPDTSAEIKDRECPRCGTLNSHSSLFCTRCGNSLTGEPQTYNNTQRTDAPTQGQSPYAGQSFNMPTGGVPFVFDPMGGVSPTEPADEGVSFGDVSKAVKSNTAYYMPVFRFLKHTGRNKFNFAAFLFSGMWLLYRKQYKSGAIITAIMLALQVGFQAVCWLIFYPTIDALALQAEYDVSTYISYEQMTSVIMLAENDTVAMLKLLSPYILLIASLAVMIFVGVRGNRMYLKHCVKTVREVKAEQLTDPEVTIEERGGVNMMAAMCGAICLFLVKTLIPLVL